jgi:hypothetical protein
VDYGCIAEEILRRCVEQGKGGSPNGYYFFGADSEASQRKSGTEGREAALPPTATFKVRCGFVAYENVV